MPFRIDDAKITHYLLSSDTPAAAAKRRFFVGIGYSLDRWTVLRDDLLQHPVMAPFEGARNSPFGRKHLHRCFLPPAPNGTRCCVRTVWQRRADGAWWLLTAYPQQVKGPTATPA